MGTNATTYADQPAQTPCCGRKLRSFPSYTAATVIYKRTCPKCHTRYQVKIVPKVVETGKLEGALISVLSWMAR